MVWSLQSSMYVFLMYHFYISMKNAMVRYDKKKILDLDIKQDSMDVMNEIYN